jgi:hypothetical protein
MTSSSRGDGARAAAALFSCTVSPALLAAAEMCDLSIAQASALCAVVAAGSAAPAASAAVAPVAARDRDQPAPLSPSSSPSNFSAPDPGDHSTCAAVVPPRKRAKVEASAAEVSE